MDAKGPPYTCPKCNSQLVLVDKYDDDEGSMWQDYECPVCVAATCSRCGKHGTVRVVCVRKTYACVGGCDPATLRAKPCRYGAECRRQDTCPYGHPAVVPCRYGAGCVKPGCTYGH